MDDAIHMHGHDGIDIDSLFSDTSDIDNQCTRLREDSTATNRRYKEYFGISLVPELGAHAGRDEEKRP